MNIYNVNTKNPRLNKFNEFRNRNGIENFNTIELASEFAKLYMDWWGSNLVLLGIVEDNGIFNPQFNVFD